jgi:hypothetical protein
MAFQNSQHFVTDYSSTGYGKCSGLFFHVLAVDERPGCRGFCQNGTESIIGLSAGMQRTERAILTVVMTS